jgi:hypothetical protein
MFLCTVYICSSSQTPAAMTVDSVHGLRGERARTGVFDGLTLHTRHKNDSELKWHYKSSMKFIAQLKLKRNPANLIGSAPKITPLQLRAAIALSA